MSNSGTITRLANSGAISGGSASSAGGAGVWNDGTLKTLTNSGAIAGGISVSAPGAGVSNESGAEIGSLVNAKFGTISGGAGRDGSEDPGGVGVSNSGTIETLINKWTIKGGIGGRSPMFVALHRAARVARACRTAATIANVDQ